MGNKARRGSRKSVLIIGSEVSPFAKTGGLADVLGALPVSLARLGWDVTVADYFPAIAMEEYSITAADALLCPSHFVAEQVLARYRPLVW